MSVSEAEWEALAAASAAEHDAAEARLAADLAAFPESPTLNNVALRDDAGAIVGMRAPSTALGLAYLAGADASLLVEQERREAFIGQPGDPGHLYRAVRLDHAQRAGNRRLAHFAGTTHALGTVTVIAIVVTSLAAAERAVTSSPDLSAAHGPDPPRPIDAPTTSPRQACAPPTRLTRGHEWPLLRVGAVGNYKEGMGVVPLAA